MIKSSKYLKKQFFKKIDNPTTKNINWSGDVSYFILFKDYIQKTYDNAEISKYKIHYFVNSDNIEIKLLDTFELYRKFQDDAIKEEYDNCKKRFIIYSCILVSASNSGHANTLIIDRKKNEAELFEPYGNLKKIIQQFTKDPDNYLNIDKFYSLLESLTKKINKKMKFYKPVDFLPDKSFQGIEESECKNLNNMYFVNTNIGFCLVWTMYFIEYRIKYQNKPRNYIIKIIMKKVNEGKINKYVCELIRNYSEFIMKIYNNKTFLEKLKFNWSLKKYIYLFKSSFYFLNTFIAYQYLKNFT